MDIYLKELFMRTLDACSPGNAVSEAISLEGKTLGVKHSSFDLKGQPLYVLSAGKASIPMYQAVHNMLDDQINGSLVVTPDDNNYKQCSAGKIIRGAHPVPNDQSLAAGQQAKAFFSEMPANAIVLNLISGGTSSLMCLPAEGIGIDDLNRTFELLNHSGAGIHEMNAIRKHCSKIKGGQLLRFLPSGVTLIDLVISDVPGDDPAVIGSGPTTPDTSTFTDAQYILKDYEIWEALPLSVKNHIQAGMRGAVPETLKEGEDTIKVHHKHIISSAGQFARQAARFAKEDGYESWVAEEAYNKPVEAMASDITQRIKDQLEEGGNGSQLLVFYGESTVQVTGNGKGGRNQELALRGALNIAGFSDISWLSAGTDGIDGPTDAAGAIIDNETIQKAQAQGIDPKIYLEQNDSYHFHEQMGTLLKTGPTGNNLMDIVFVRMG